MRIVQFTEILKRSANAKSEVLLMKKKPHALIEPLVLHFTSKDNEYFAKIGIYKY